MDASMSNNTKAAYAVEVIGFNQTERIVLSSIFGLSARRSPKFLQHTTVTYSPDLYLVDAADTQAVALFKARNASYKIPAIFIGDNNFDTPFPVLARPLQWTKLFKAFDLAIASTPSAEAASTASTLTQTQMFAATLPTATAISKLAEDITSLNTTSFAALPVVVPKVTIATAPASAPAAPPAKPAPVPVTAAAPPVAVAPVSINNADWVLVVDDNVTVREFMKTKLAPFGFNVDYAESGEEAVGYTGQKSYTCVFLDVIMPGIDGYQVCKLIKSKKTSTKTAVVMLTSKGSPFDRIRGAMAGCDAYLTKPVDEDKLLETIVKFLPIKAIG
jgi:two-component system, cell cycle response regulator